MSEVKKVAGPEGEPIRLCEGVYVDVRCAHGADWFPMYLEAGLWTSTLFLRRAQLRALRDRLDEIDRAMPEPGVRS